MNKNFIEFRNPNLDLEKFYQRHKNIRRKKWDYVMAKKY